jgi:hypothetical protein
MSFRKVTDEQRRALLTQVDELMTSQGIPLNRALKQAKVSLSRYYSYKKALDSHGPEVIIHKASGKVARKQKKQVASQQHTPSGCMLFVGSASDIAEIATKFRR